MEFLFGQVEINPTLENSFIDRKNIKTFKNRQFTASLPVRAIFENAKSFEVRKLLNLNKSQILSDKFRPKTTGKFKEIYQLKSDDQNLRHRKSSLNFEEINIDSLFKDFDQRLYCKNIPSEEEILGEEQLFIKEPYSKSNVSFLDKTIIKETSEIDNHPKLNPSEKSKMLLYVLEKSRALYSKSSG